ncbi:DNA polymerase subunit gamma-2, mitochondrial isoform X1 [Pararge aegeria]|uniref:DNA polymerase subunit gamma-2, mitochondrial isoform X1 n=1 Tax=Pararge aegeria TaxID=116150 RepID=UPI0019D31861|nr:DNA polymerase subunit gamma-2, mitochondrial isoform X1 [Pararge aegeria]
MKTDLQKLTSLAKFLTSKHSLKTKTVISLEKPSRILLQNIYCSWLKSIHGKTLQHFSIYLDKNIAQLSQKFCYGFIKPQSVDIDELIIDNSNDDFKPRNTIKLKLNLVVPQEDIMQYFIQWQRYRKYWWSSITTTPSLFSINMMQGVESADVNIIANFSCGSQIVETIGINSNDSENNNNHDARKTNKQTIILKFNATHTSSLTCAMGLETALLTLLLDGITNATKEEYLKLHNKMAPYKISFALDSKDEKILSILKELAQLIFHKLSKNEISSWLPNFTLPLQLQIKENLQMGVTYTAILNENTLSNGIFHLLNSNTMLKESFMANSDPWAGWRSKFMLQISTPMQLYCVEKIKT